MLWQGARLSWRWKIRRFFSVLRPLRCIEDEGDWSYSTEWWGTESKGHTVFDSNSGKGNGVISVVAYPSSRPVCVLGLQAGHKHRTVWELFPSMEMDPTELDDAAQWLAMERWLQERYAKIYPESEHNGLFRILGYQWRVLCFNENTRQSTVKIMAAYRKSDPGTVYLMQQPHCLAVPYLKSMVSVGLSQLVSCNYDLVSAACGKKTMHVLCIGHGGGSLPLFLASKIQGAVVHIVEIDPLVISTSVQAMGFPASVTMKVSSSDSTLSHLDTVNQVLWKGLQERLFLYEADAEDFILHNENLYDLVFIDAYDGDDIFPYKLWDRHGPFLGALKSRVHPKHGTVVVNLHADSDVLTLGGSILPDHYHMLPMGKYVSQVCRSYKDVLLGKREERPGFAFAVSVPWLCNISLVVCRGACFDKDSALDILASKSRLVEDALDLPFSCFQYLKRGFVVVD